MAYAFYAFYASGKQPTLTLSQTLSPVRGPVIPVKGKAEARKVAAQHQALPWNF